MVKFSKQLKKVADPSHLNNCVSYDVLKKAINVIVASESQRVGDDAHADVNDDLRAVSEVFGRDTSVDLAPQGGSSRPADSRFHELLQRQLAKVNRFASLQLRAIIDALREAERPLYPGLEDRRRTSILAASPAAAAGAASIPGGLSEEQLSEIEGKLDSVADELVKLDQFRQLNQTAFRKIVKKYDKQMASVGAGNLSGNLSSWFVPQLIRETFASLPLDRLIVLLGWGYSRLRRLRFAGLPARQRLSSAASDAPRRNNLDLLDGGRATSLYWLTPASRMRVLCTLVKRFEVIMPPATPAEAGPMTSTSVAEQHQEQFLDQLAPENLVRMPRPAADTYMVYFDDSSLSQYKQRLASPDEVSACGFRCRATRLAGDTTLFDVVERDRCPSALSSHVPMQREHAEPFSLGADAMQSQDAALFNRQLKRAAEAAAADASNSRRAGLATEVCRMAAEQMQGPRATVGCSRILLRGDTAGTQGVTLALDEDVRFSRQPIGKMQDGGNEFPYALLEVATELSASEDKAAGWLQEVQSFAALRHTAGFSVGTQAIAALYPDEPEKPHWHQHITAMEVAADDHAWSQSAEFRRAVSEARDAEGNRERRASEGKVGEAAGDAPDAMRMAHAMTEETEKTVRILPKNFLASERTMLEWMHTSLALAFMGLALWRVSLSEDGPDDLAPLFGLLSRSSPRHFFLGCYSLLLVAFAVAFAWHATFAHLRRNNALFKDPDAHTERIFNSRFGPTAFAVAIGAALLLHMVVQVLPSVFDAGLPETASQMSLVANYSMPVLVAAR
eukprot:TRINITY_DN36525_c1_g1_i1.p1 TRINITY_DN36525_c1_g1~~TRINITY_DN36525_c1_g1_i1.p1  ORF type:complete len:790 (-),score=178.34 TRINITY_DN36525_c1_g1_i1:165-2534(-)